MLLLSFKFRHIWVKIILVTCIKWLLFVQRSSVIAPSQIWIINREVRVELLLSKVKISRVLILQSTVLLFFLSTIVLIMTHLFLMWTFCFAKPLLWCYTCLLVQYQPTYFLFFSQSNRRSDKCIQLCKFTWLYCTEACFCLVILDMPV